MIPVGTSVRTHRFPWITLALVAASVLVFLYELALGPYLDAFVMRWGATSSFIMRALAGDPRVPSSVLWTLLTSQFIHAGWAHLLGNMLFLWVFGRAVEDRLGHIPYLLLYLTWGVGAALVQVYLMGPTRQPMVGASGAISGVLGAYFLLFPGAWVSLLVPIFFFFWVINVPAFLVLAYWFLVQFLNGAAAITWASHATAGVAFWAHVGGFVLGAATAMLLPGTSRPQAQPLPRRYYRETPRGPLWTAASLLSVAADTMALLVALRALLLLVGVGPRGLLGPLAQALYAITLPMVEPFADVLPALRVGGAVLEVYSIAAAMAYWGAGALLAWTIAGFKGRGSRAP